MQRVLTAIILTLCAVTLWAADPPQGIARIVAYTSPVDRSQQEYGLYLPTSPPPTPAGYPAILQAHGYGWAVDGGFSPWQRAWADGHGFVLVNANVRGPVFGDGVGDVAGREIIEDLVARFGVDRTRVCYTGGSMGGTTALRAGVRHPDLYAAVYGVDGWADFREWHWHWYAREDMRDRIEEFRRPLLEAASPLYSAGRAMWGVTGSITDGRDNVVYPDNGIRLEAALTNLANDHPPQYDHTLTLNYGLGHCGGYDIGRIYDYFAERVAHPSPGAFRIETTLLAHGSLYWGEMQAIHNQGETAVLDCQMGAGAVWATTSNLDSFTLHLEAMPASSPCAAGAVLPPRPKRLEETQGEGGRGGEEDITVYADGFACYSGPAASVTVEAIRDAAGALTGWRVADPPRPFQKSGGLEGPIGQAVTQPFVVVYGVSGDANDVARHQREAEAFAVGWNNFYVHGAGVTATPEDKLPASDLAERSVFLYGSLETSALLRRAQESRPLPVEVHEDRILVRDDVTGDRSYDGAQFGCFFAYPNPLTNGRTYLVVCTGQWATNPDGGARQGLEYDIERIPWAYPDYQVFNTDIKQIPHVKNVNNKPPVTCYDAGYVVEAGYFDNNWRPARDVELQRVAHTNPANVKVIHVANCEVGFDAGQRRMTAKVTVVDAGGGRVSKARVTGRFGGQNPAAVSGVTGDDGTCTLACAADGLKPFRALNLAATSATYDFRADALPWSCFADDRAGLALRPVSQLPTIMAGDQVAVEADVSNLGSAPVVARCTLSSPVAQGARAILPTQEYVTLTPGDTHRVSFQWRTAGVSAGTQRLLWQAQVVGLAPVAAPLVAQIVSRPRVRVVGCAPADITSGDRIAATATLVSETDEAETVTLVGTVPEGKMTLPGRRVTVPAGDSVTVTLVSERDEKPLPRGVYHAVLSVLDCPGAGMSGEFTVR